MVGVDGAGTGAGAALMFLIPCTIARSRVWLTYLKVSSDVPFVTSTTIVPLPLLPVLPFRWMLLISDGTAS